MPRKKLPPGDPVVAKKIGGLLRDLRKAAHYRAVRDAAADPACPAAQQTIYAYERGGLIPSLTQLMELVEFYALKKENVSNEVRYQAVAVMVAALSTDAYHLPSAYRLIERLQPQPATKPRRKPGRT